LQPRVLALDLESEGESVPRAAETLSDDSSATDDGSPIRPGMESPPMVDDGRPVRTRMAPLRLSPVLGGKAHRFKRGTEYAERVLPPPPVANARVSHAHRAGIISRATLNTTTSWIRAGHVFATVPAATWSVPTSLKQADASPEADLWFDARMAELDRLNEMGCWVYVECPEWANVIGSKWVFAFKFNADGTINKVKARLVAQGCGQEEGIDYEETFAPTAGKSTIRVFLALVAATGMHLHQMDVTTAFLYGYVDKEIYMRQPPGHGDGTNRVCKLVRSIYGLKQAPRIWCARLKTALLGFGFTVSMADPTLYILQREGRTLYLVDFVDDMLLASHSMELIDWVKAQLVTEFKMTDLGPAAKYVGISIVRNLSSGEMWLHQAQYCVTTAEKYGCGEGPYPDNPLPSDFVVEYPWEVPGAVIDPAIKRVPDASLDAVELKLYQKIVGSLNFAACTTRPDISFAVAQLSRMLSRPRQRHLKAAKRLVSFLAGTADWALHFSASKGTVLDCYVDASYGGDLTRKSTTGLLLTLAGSPVYWASRKQDRISTSTCDAESQAVMTAVQYVESLRDILEELGCRQDWPTPLFNDNSATIKLCHDARAHKRSVQLTRPMAYVRERTLYGVISPLHIRTDAMPADFLTKRLSTEAYSRCRAQTGMCPVPAPADPKPGGVS
jgi:Reverse transcriptase (RNA-dependent DNA polymerase)